MDGTRWLRLGTVVGLLLALFMTVPVRPGDGGTTVVRSLGALLLLVLATAVLLWQLRLTAEDGDRRVDGLVASVGLVVMAFALGFYALEVHRPGEVAGLTTRVDALYFTCSTMLTIGYGDVHAVGQGARVLVLVQMLVDIVLVAAAGSLLANRLRERARARARRGEPEDVAGEPARDR
ncbi:potassium channel family protein [Aeromicrobium sp. IC_218]|uniref:potassium channel family protein n=1 Tax=Aeromicrobium sp. IC_218 TaxID=2545468 RepID=UPI00103E6F33|nr:potassium channel family protein [Aeromicrobium sp. IC_218]TCI97653.1 two pore domain potassium channel family protein [Aeromicrobium sp. IC_218]